MSFAFMRLYTGDYLRDTRHLSPQKHGVYLLLLMHCWDQQGPVPLDEQEAAGVANCRSADEIESLRYVLQRFFTKTGDGWYNKRMNDEIVSSEFYSKAMAKAGKKSGEARKMQAQLRAKARKHAVLEPTLNLGSTLVEPRLLSPSPSLSLKPKVKPSSSKAPEKYPPGFSQFWAAYPRKVGKDAAFAKWKARRPDPPLLELMLAAITAQRQTDAWTKDGGQFIPHPATWLSQGRWQDEID